uniref:Matrix metalloproteinase n=1 Tax=Pinctada fucata TaxID=50426 RepID=A0A2Z6G1A6_PINFU|nr:matrix metalloproteinase [Pinctada fucata]
MYQWSILPPRALLVTILLCMYGDYVYGQAQIEGEAMKYLSHFHYLPKASREQENLLHGENIKEAIKNLQRMGNIPVTGKVDERTRTLMHKKRCGVADPVDELFGTGRGRRRRKRYVLAPTKWKKYDLTYRILNYTPDLPVYYVRKALLDAFQVWSTVTKLTFTESMHGDADIMIQFASGYHKDGYPFDGKGLILAHAFFPGKGKGGDTHFDEAEHWTFNSSETGVDLFMVAAHEFGHALGLSHSNEPGALMYPWYQGYDPNFKLPYDDIRGIQTIYGGVGSLPRPPPQTPRPRTPNIYPTGGGGGGGRQPRPKGPIDPCNATFDAISVIRQEVFLFIGKYFWRLDSRGLVKGEPLQIHSFWYKLPKEIDHFDAVYESKKDGKIVFFVGDRYWRFDGNYPVVNTPKKGNPITDFGIPADIKKIDAVFIWGFNQRTYLVSGDMYWKLQEDQDYVEPDYPRDMNIWKNVPVPLDTAFQYWDGKTYFFKDKMVYKFYDMKMRVDKKYPKPIKNNFLGCNQAHTYMTIDGEAEKLKKSDNSSDKISHSVVLSCLCLIFFYTFKSNCGS